VLGARFGYRFEIFEVRVHPVRSGSDHRSMNSRIPEHAFLNGLRGHTVDRPIRVPGASRWAPSGDNRIAQNDGLRPYRRSSPLRSSLTGTTVRGVFPDSPIRRTKISWRSRRSRDVVVWKSLVWFEGVCRFVVFDSPTRVSAPSGDCIERSTSAVGRYPGHHGCNPVPRWVRDLRSGSPIERRPGRLLAQWFTQVSSLFFFYSIVEMSKATHVLRPKSNSRPHRPTMGRNLLPCDFCWRSDSVWNTSLSRTHLFYQHACRDDPHAERFHRRDSGVRRLDSGTQRRTPRFVFESFALSADVRSRARITDSQPATVCGE